MATPNYSYEKRQRELAKKRKKEEKLKKRSERGDAPAEGSNDTHAQPGTGGGASVPSEGEPTPPATP